MQKAKEFILSHANEVVEVLLEGVLYNSNFSFFETREIAEEALITDLRKFLSGQYDKLVWVVEPMINHDEANNLFQPFTRFLIA